MSTKNSLSPARSGVRVTSSREKERGSQVRAREREGERERTGYEPLRAAPTVVAGEGLIDLMWEGWGSKVLEAPPRTAGYQEIFGRGRVEG